MPQESKETEYNFPKCKCQEDYENVIRTMHKMLLEQDEPDPKLEKMLRARVKSWYEYLIITIQIPGNEKMKWQPHEIGYLTEKMPLKVKSGYDQTGDYAIHIRSTETKLDIIAGFLGERKSAEDLESTIGNEYNFRRLIREIKRYIADPRYIQMVIFVETNKDTFLNSLPDKVADNTKRNRARSQGKKWEPMSKHERLDLRKRTMEAKLAKLETMGIGIHWGGNRESTAYYYGYCVRHWILNNYDKIINMNTEN